ncbi:MAG: GAF domain-containing protein [Luteimonas sp.]
MQVAGIISSTPDIDTMLQRAADVVHELLGYPNIHIAQIDPSDPEMLVVRIRGGGHKRLSPRQDRQPIDCGIMGAAVRQRRTQLINDVEQDSRYVTPAGAAPAFAELAVPIVSGDEVLGVLNVESQHPFDDLDQQCLEVVAENMALAIQGGRLFDQLRHLAVLEERERLARDLHDNMTQILSSISLISQSLAEAWGIDPIEGARRAGRLDQLAQMGFSALREMLGELSPIAAVRREPGELPQQGAVDITELERHGLAVAAERVVSTMLPPHIAYRMDFIDYRPQVLEHENALLRICHEAISNALRHAFAAELEISAGIADDHVWLFISDDGQGFSTASASGRGMANMGHRALSLGGAFHVAARLPSGTRLEVRLPRQDRDL